MFGDPGHAANNNRPPADERLIRFGFVLIVIGLAGMIGVAVALLLA